MPADVEQLAIIKSQTLARIVDITAQPKPSYQIDGQRVDWETYLKQLQATVVWCDEQLQANDRCEESTQIVT